MELLSLQPACHLLAGPLPPRTRDRLVGHTGGEAVPFPHHPVPVAEGEGSAHLMDRLLHLHSWSQRLCGRGPLQMWHAKASVVGEPPQFPAET